MKTERYDSERRVRELELMCDNARNEVENVNESLRREQELRTVAE